MHDVQDAVLPIVDLYVFAEQTEHVLPFKYAPGAHKQSDAAVEPVLTVVRLVPHWVWLVAPVVDT